MSRSGSLEELLYASASGDQDAFAELYVATSSRLMAVALTVLGNRGLAEEALQDAFVQIWHASSHYRADLGKPYTWLAAIVRNRALDIQRKERRSPVNPEADYENHVLPDTGNPASTSSELQALLHCMDRLPKDQRKSILMAYYLGHTHEEISRRLTQPLGTVKAWIRRGVSQIRECLER